MDLNLTDITGTGRLILTGDLQIDCLNYLCLTEEAQEATTNQIANDLVQLHKLNEAENELGNLKKANSPRLFISADLDDDDDEKFQRQLMSVQRIARDLIELQAMLARKGNFYTLSFLEKFYKK